MTKSATKAKGSGEKIPQAASRNKNGITQAESAAAVAKPQAETPSEQGLVCPRQIGMLFAAFLPLCKLLNLPALLSASAKNDLWIAVFLLIAVDFCTLLLLLFAAERGVRFPAALYRVFGRWGGRVCLGALALFFLLKTFVFLGEARIFVLLGLYETTPSFFYFAPLFLFAFFLLKASPTAIGRAADVCAFLTLGGLFALLAFALPSTRFSALFPPLYQNGRGMLSALQTGAVYFGEGLYPLFFMGKISLPRGEKRKIIGGFLIGAAATVCFFAVFYAVFSSVAESVPIALADLSKHNLSVSEIGRVDYFSIAAILLSSTVGLLLPAYFAARCGAALFSQEEGKKGRAWCAFGFSLLLAATVKGTEAVYAQAATEIRKWFFILSVLFQVALPLFLAAYAAKKGRKNGAERGRINGKSEPLSFKK